MITVTALFDFTAQDEAGLSFKQNDVIIVHQQLISGWWDGECNGSRGWFPCNYVSRPDQPIDTLNAEENTTWTRQVTADGQIFYLNRFTGEASFGQQQLNSASISAGSTDSSNNKSLRTYSNDSSIYDLPSAAPLSSNSSDYSNNSTLVLPAGWTTYRAEDGSIVYYHFATKELSRVPPPGTLSSFPSDEIKKESVTDSAGLNNQSTTSTSKARASKEAKTETIAKNDESKGNSAGDNTLENQSHQSSSPQSAPPKENNNNESITWSSLLASVTSAIQSLDASTRLNQRAKFLPQSLSIVEAIRFMLAMSGASRRSDGSAESDGAMQSQIQLQPHFKDIMDTLSVLIYHAKLAYGFSSSSSSTSSSSTTTAPPADMIEKMQVAIGEVLRAVQSFVEAAQDAGIEIRRSGDDGRVSGSFTSPDSTASAAGAGGGGGASVEDSAAAGLSAEAESIENRLSPKPSMGQSVGGRISLSHSDISGGSSGDGGGGGSAARDSHAYSYPVIHQNEVNDELPVLNSEVILHLEGYTATVVSMISALARSIENNVGVGTSDFSHMLITDVRAIVMEVGNFLSIADELPLDLMPEEMTVNFKVSRLTLYNSISGLVMTTSNATNQFPPSNAVEQVIIATGNVAAAVQDLLVATKALILDKERLDRTLDWDSLQRYMNSSNSAVNLSAAPDYLEQQQQFHLQQQYNLQLQQQHYHQQHMQLQLQLKMQQQQQYNAGNIPNSHPLNSYGGSPSGGYFPGSSRLTSPPPQQYNQQQQQLGYNAAMGPGTPTSSAPPQSPVSSRRLNSWQSSSVHAVEDRSFSPSTSARRSGDMEVEDELSGLTSRMSFRKNKSEKAASSRDSLSTYDASNKEGGSKPWYLGYDYSPEDIVLNSEGKVRGGKLPVLVERLTLHDYSDQTYLQAFLLTYRSFTTAAEFFGLLKKRFVIVPPIGLSNSELEEWNMQKRVPIRLRVFNVMKSWVENYSMPDNEEDKGFFQEMKQFAATLTEEEAPIPALATQLLKLIERREKGGMKKIVVTALGKDVPPPILPRSLKKVKFLDIDPLEVARQLTIIDSKAYSKLQPVEFLGKAWSDKERNDVAVNVKAMILMSNQISGWVGRSILSEDQMKKRAKLITRFIEIAEKCRILNNFNTLMAILSGLNASHIHRLKRTWELVLTKNHQILESLNVLMDTSKNRLNYREAVHSVNPPCVPFLGLYLTDLTFIDDGNKDFLQNHDGMINFAKRMKTSEVIRELQQYQNVPYLFTPVPELQDFIKESFVETTNEADLYKMSLSLEPREREDEKIARVLTESGFL